MRQEWGGPTTEMVLLRGELPQGLPPSTPPASLTRDRQAYMYRHIRPFVDDKRDIACPKPATPQSSQSPSQPSLSPSHSSQSASSSDSDTDWDVPLSKRARGTGRGARGRPWRGRGRRGARFECEQ